MYTQMKDVIIRGVGDPPILFRQPAARKFREHLLILKSPSVRFFYRITVRTSLFCLNETNTESAYQALIDYNMVGTTSLSVIISRISFFGIENGIISFGFSFCG